VKCKKEVSVMIEKIDYLKDYSKDNKMLEVSTSNKLVLAFRFLDEDGEDWLIGKQLNNRYRRVKLSSIKSLKIENL